ncbi:MAG TPA: SDR family oxidoreductase [Actinomycetota bacterium]|nr:SDR family oxidoreductase [Actinomycetota bacterium]
MAQLEGRNALITGGTTGLGFAMAERFLNEGARVVITGRDRSLGEQAESRLRASGDAWFLRADAADDVAVWDSVEAAVERLGALDVLVNNAGIGVAARTVDTPVEDFDRVMAVNVRGYFLYARAAYPHLAARRGCMIHVSSDAGVTGEHSIGAYSVSKAAVIMLSKMLALDGGPAGVRSNCICPGDILPGMRHFAPVGDGSGGSGGEDDGDWPVPPIGRIGQATDVANAAVYLAGEGSSFVSGAVLLVDGGMRAGFNPPR